MKTKKWTEIFFTEENYEKSSRFQIYELSVQKNGEEEVEAARNTCKRLWLKHSLAMSSFTKVEAKNILLIFSKLKEKSEKFLDVKAVAAIAIETFCPQISCKNRNFLYKLLKYEKWIKQKIKASKKWEELYVEIELSLEQYLSYINNFLLEKRKMFTNERKT